jgi:N6-adenosine-specific RNA methylase IME4
MPLASLEHINERGLSTFIEVGMALMAIREGKKYKDAGYTDFNKYIEERWGMNSRYGKYLLNSGFIANELGTIVPKIPTHEGQARPLTRLGTPEKIRDGFPQPECWIDAWEAACDLAGDKPPTAKEVEYVVGEMLYQEPPPIPPGKYRVIYADPPWQYGDRLVDGYGPAEEHAGDNGALGHYPVMTIEQLCELPIKNLAADNAVLFLWVTSPLLEECFEVIEAWGFEYKASFIWDKVKHNYGHYNSVRHELLLLCTRGSCLPDNSELFDSVQSIERSDRHSEKPEEFRKIIDNLYHDGNRIELFARVKVEGWEAWGNEPSIIGS